MSEKRVTNGTVYLVGAGPGDPGLIAISGIDALRKADVILYDYLVNPVLTAHAHTEAELVCLGKHGTTRIWTQEQINERMVGEASRGRCVVRLKSGDPSIFGRLAEEIACLEEASIPYVIVPGISAASAAGAYAGIPVTHREHASAVAFVTGREARGKQGEALDFAALAGFPGTLVIYMGVTTAATWTRELIDGGLDAATPVALVRKCSLPQQRVIRCQLGDVASQVTPYSRFPPPVIAIVGEVARDSPLPPWFMSLPLFGKTVLVTRSKHQAQRLQKALVAKGAHVLHQPAINIRPPDRWADVDAAIMTLNEFDWVVFSSANGVRSFCDRLRHLGFDARQFGTSQLAAIGPRTAEALLQYGLHADVVPQQYEAEALAESMTRELNQRPKCLLVRASRGREVLRQRLQDSGALVEEVVAYLSVDVEPAAVAAEVSQALAEGSVDWITVTSSAIASSLHHIFGEALNDCRLASISPLTSQALNELGHDVDAEALEYTIEGLVAAILAAENGGL